VTLRTHMAAHHRRPQLTSLILRFRTLGTIFRDGREENIGCRIRGMEEALQAIVSNGAELAGLVKAQLELATGTA
jgi:hypothetical protein